MCLFSSEVEHVADTRIFARADGDHQYLAYQMQLRSQRELAMILPLPTPPACDERAVGFLNAADSYDLFRELATLFLAPIQSHGSETSLLFGFDGPSPLQVHSVGDYEASFVPTMADFARLDPRFRLPTAIWSQLPMYADWGFAVFKLRPQEPPNIPMTALDLRIAAERKRDGKPPLQYMRRTPPAQTHPIAFRFPRRDPGTLFFPTMHVHDGSWQPVATFDHLIYAQRRKAGGSPAPSAAGPSWQVSHREAQPTAKTAAAQLLRVGQPVLRLALRGEFANADTVLPDP